MTRLEPDHAVVMLRTMMLIRAFEQKMLDVFAARKRQGESIGALHSCEGQEAIPVGACACLRRDDYVFSTHRGHGHALAKGAPLDKVVAELMGRATGLCGGWGGSMHLFAPEIGLMGGNGIVGGGLPLALGTAYAARYRGTDQVTVCFFGEGAASQGSLHESLNMATLQGWPVIYLCENNLYAATTHVRRNCSAANIADRSAGYGLPCAVVDGNDVLAVREAVGEAVTRARGGGGPSFLECKTYRHRAHCMVIPEHRPAEEIELWRNHDPIARFRNRLLAEGVITNEQANEMAQEIADALAAAVEKAYAAAQPDPATVTSFVYAE